MDNLKPCPLCGGNDLQVDEMKDMFENDDSVWWRVICLYCRGEVPGETEAEAEAALKGAEHEIPQETRCD